MKSLRSVGQVNEQYEQENVEYIMGMERSMGVWGELQGVNREREHED